MGKRIGIIGSGMVAKALGPGFLKYGYEVMLGTRDASKLTEWQSGDGQGSELGTFSETADFGDILVLAVSGKAAKSALEMAVAQNLSGKTIIDATNPISDEGPTNGVLHFFTDINESLMEQLQNAYPDAHFVKAFSCVGNAFMVDPPFDSKPTMFICGNQDQSKEEVTNILEQFGWETADMGTVEAARAIEPLCILWCIPAFREGTVNHALKMLKI